MLKIFDCSNSLARPGHRGGGGPLQNDVMRQLAENAHKFGATFITDLAFADVVVTNDVFTPEALARGVPRIKRMDGVFFQEALLVRNEALNTAALQANHVVFISEDSKRAYDTLYGTALKASSVVLNRADAQIYCRRPYSYGATPLRFVASATDWARPEKRLTAVLDFAREAAAEVHLIGALPLKAELPSNVVSHGYLACHKHVTEVMRHCDAMVSLSYRDAAPKTVGQGLATGLPVLYASHGGVPELVAGCGLGIEEAAPIRVEQSIPVLSSVAIHQAYSRFEAGFPGFVQCLYARDPAREFDGMLKGYFTAIHSVT